MNLIKQLPLWIRQVMGIAVASIFISALVTLAATWTGPSANPPGGNPDAPINVSATAQTKTGNLTLSGGLNMANTMITNVLGPPVNGTDAANRAYVDAQTAQQQFYMIKTVQQGNATAIDCGPGYIIVQCGSTGGSTSLSQSNAKNYTLEGFTGTNSTYNCGFDFYGTRSYVTNVPTATGWTAAMVLCMKDSWPF